ncbi:MAG: NfeD family protein [Acidobacteriota bacterium]
MLVAITFLGLAIVAVIAMFLSLTHGAGSLTLIARLFPRTRPEIFREEAEANRDGFVPTPPLEHLVGQVGVLERDARPIGMARFGAERVEVVAEGGFLARGARVRALRSLGSELLVRPE